LKLISIEKRLQQKVESYNTQDRHKGRLVYNHKYKAWNRKRLDIDDIEYLIEKNGLKCYYCSVFTRINPHYRFDKKQFTLDRIDNTDTHHRENVLIACWGCNEERGDDYTVAEFKKLKQKK